MDFLPYMVRKEVFISLCKGVMFDGGDGCSIESLKLTLLSVVIHFWFLLSALNYKHFRAGNSRVERSPTFPGNLHTSAYIPYTCVYMRVCVGVFWKAHGAQEFSTQFKTEVKC